MSDISRTDYYAAHAPEIPGWFERKWEWVDKTVPAPEFGRGWVRKEATKIWESEEAFLIRWRFHYANAMVAQSNKELSLNRANDAKRFMHGPCC